jgi:serine/threonine protein kinase
MPSLPTHISRYEIKSRIGRGGMGDLYLASDPNIGRLVALKLLNATLDSAELRERFAREARALAALNHPNIVNIYDTGEFDDSPFIVMEYVRGETLAEMIKRRAPLSVSQKLKLMEDLCAGLAQAHDAGIIHRDIKPANLMVDQQGRLKILDFGIARVVESSKTRIGVPLTQVNVSIGTPGYMSPEQIEGGEVDHRSDIFAVGAVCYELLSYNEAFAGMNTRQIESRVLRGQPAPLATIVPGLDPEIDEIVLRALKRDPNKRYQDALTFERALARLRSRLADIEGTPYRATPPPPQNQRGMSREARAEAAYLRALHSFQNGSSDAARRSAVEAVAEDPSHAGARELLKRIEQRAVPMASILSKPPAAPQRTEVATSVNEPAPTQAASGTSIPGSSSATIASSSATFASSGTVASSGPRAQDPTVVSGRTAVPGRTVASGRIVTSGAASAPTILVPPPPPKKRGLRAKYQTLVSNLRATRAKGGTRDHAPRRSHEPLRTRYPRAMTAAVLAVILVAIVTLVWLITSWLRPSGMLLTIARPVGGTIRAAGITCGTSGNDCSTQFPRGEAVELTPEPDTGYRFVGYTGDCAPAGRTVMSAARACGATFEAEPVAPPAAATQTLTISPVPTGGTLEGVDILCGSKGSACSANIPDKQIAELRPTADPEYTFMGFTGDCGPGGQVQMAGPRTCSATFSKTKDVSAAPNLPPRIARGDGSRGNPPGTTTQPTQPTDQAPRGGGPAPPQNPNANPNAGKDPQAPHAPPGEVKAPQTDEEFAKTAIKAVLTEYCHAYETLDPAAVQRVYPKMDKGTIQIQLNKSKYKSIQCKFADPVFNSLDAAAGSASVQADVKYVFEHTAVKTAPETLERIATLSFSRPNPRSPWFIDKAQFRPKPK